MFGKDKLEKVWKEAEDKIQLKVANNGAFVNGKFYESKELTEAIVEQVHEADPKFTFSREIYCGD